MTVMNGRAGLQRGAQQVTRRVVTIENLRTGRCRGHGDALHQARRRAACGGNVPVGKSSSRGGQRLEASRGVVNKAFGPITNHRLLQRQAGPQSGGVAQDSDATVRLRPQPTNGIEGGSEHHAFSVGRSCRPVTGIVQAAYRHVPSANLFFLTVAMKWIQTNRDGALD